MQEGCTFDGKGMLSLEFKHYLAHYGTSPFSLLPSASNTVLTLGTLTFRCQQHGAHPRYAQPKYDHSRYAHSKYAHTNIVGAQTQGHCTRTALPPCGQQA